MKSRFSFGRLMLAAVAVVFMSAFLVSCTKNLDTGTPAPSAGVMVLNLATDQDAIGVALSNSVLTSSPLGFTNFTGNYRSVYTGERQVAVYDYLTDSVIAKSNFNFEDGELYSVFVTGNKGVYTPLVVKDEVDSTASAEKAYVRFVNAIADSSSPTVTVNAGGSKVFEGPAAFKTVSPFTAVNEGDVNVRINNGSGVSADRTIKLQKGWVYTALLIGDPQQSDTTKRVQIRYIQNGVVPAGSDK